MCCSGAKWKREVVPDHKFDFVDTHDFVDHGFVMRVKYLLLYVTVLIAFLVYVIDIFTATTMLTTESWSNQIFEDCEKKQPDLDGCIAIPFAVGKWLFVGCIIFSFLLLAYEARKAKKIVASRDISYAFTNVMAHNYYSLRSYAHFCFFNHISDSTKTSDDVAFFVFFTFKGWKRILLADAPRQTINALTLYAIFLSKRDTDGEWWEVDKYFRDSELSTKAITLSTTFTVLVFAVSLLLLIAAGVCYIPLLCHIQGNLKEYCCHKVDKRISVVIHKRRKQRLAQLQKEEASGKGDKNLPQPTLPNLSVDDDDDVMSTKGRSGPASTYTYNTQDNYYFNQDQYIPPMPAYNPNSNVYDSSGNYAHYNQSVTSYAYDDPHGGYPPSGQQANQWRYDDDNDSQMHLASSAAPFAHHSQYSIERPGTTAPLPNPHSTNSNLNLNAYDVYQGKAHDGGYDAAGTASDAAYSSHYPQQQQQAYGVDRYGASTPQSHTRRPDAGGGSGYAM